MAVIYTDIDTVRALLQAGADPMPAKKQCERLLKAAYDLREEIGDSEDAQRCILHLEEIMTILKAPIVDLSSKGIDDNNESDLIGEFSIR